LKSLHARKTLEPARRTCCGTSRAKRSSDAHAPDARMLAMTRWTSALMMSTACGSSAADGAAILLRA
jgi:hypothetical protein